MTDSTVTNSYLNVSDLQLLFKSPQSKFEHNFGTCNIRINKGEPLWGALHLVFNLDRSGSTGAGSEGKDGKTAWDNIVHTMKCTLNYCKEHNVQVFVSIILFDHKTIEMCQSKEVTEENVKILSQNLSDRIKYYPRGSTDIHKAMLKAQEMAVHDFDEWCVEKPYQTFHLLMTDGCPTAGPCDLTTIATAMPKEVENYLLGFGSNHNEKLLNALVEKSVKGGEYHFTPTFEQAGVIYGTVLDSIFNRFAQTVTVTVKHAELYDYKTNTWVTELKLGPMAFESERMLHLRFPWDNMKDREICVTYKTLGDSGEHILWKYNKEYSTEENKDDKMNLEVYKYFLRQEVMEILYHRKHKTFPDDKLRKNIAALGELIKTFMKDNNLDEDAFLNQLCDDLSIALHSMEMSAALGDKLCLDRQVSQATQRGYNAAVPARMQRFDAQTAPAATAALKRTPLFRNHTQRGAAARSTSAYAAPRQMAAQRMCSLGVDDDVSDDEFYDASVHPAACPHAASFIPPRPPARRSLTTSYCARNLGNVSAATSAPPNNIESLVKSWTKQAKDNITKNQKIS